MFSPQHNTQACIAHKEILCDALTPLSALDTLKAKVLLESAYNETGKDRYSILILNEAFRVSKQNKAHFLTHYTHNQPTQVPLDTIIHSLNLAQKPKKDKEAKLSKNAQSLHGPITDALLSEISESSLAKDNTPKDTPKANFLRDLSLIRTLSPNPTDSVPHHLPLPLGGAGYVGYEFFAEIEEVEFSNPPLYDAPECCFIFGRDFLIFDHLFDRLHIISVGYTYEDENALKPLVWEEAYLANHTNIPKAKSHKERIEQRVEILAFAIASIPHSIQTPPDSDYTWSIQSSTSQEEFSAIVSEVKSKIYQGDMLQCVPSQSLTLSSSLPPLSAYRTLRHQNPSPYMFYYDFDDFIVLGASPEIMLRLKSQGSKSVLTLRPIAGTRPRGVSVAKDLDLEQDLLSDSKELSEHLMLVDLARNDAGKVSAGGGVSVVSRNKIERYSRVMHIVSEVQGILDTKRFDKIDAFRAVFPAGTLTGAPKIEAIKTIETLESSSRGIYGGAIGYFTYDEDMDFAIAIRTAVYQKGVYYLRSGAGIVYDSDEVKEFKETQNKMQALLDMLDVSQNTPPPPQVFKKQGCTYEPNR